jgi:hypothetical protein
MDFLRSPARGGGRKSFEMIPLEQLRIWRRILQAKIYTCIGPWDSRRLRLPELLENRHIKIARSSAICTGRLYPQKILLVHIPGLQCGRKNEVNE